MDDVFQYVIQTPIIETPVRGLMLQRYIIQRLETASGVTLRTCQYKSNHALGASLNILLVQRQMRKVEWNGNSVPQMTLSRSEDVLLVPLSPTYPGVDFLTTQPHYARVPSPPPLKNKQLEQGNLTTAPRALH